jgi:hypothetical protein
MWGGLPPIASRAKPAWRPPGRLIELGLGGAPFIRFNRVFQLGGAHINTDDRGYSAEGSQITLMHAGSPDLNARSRAGLISPGRSTISP